MSRHAVFSLGPGLPDAERRARLLLYGCSLTAGYPDYEPYAKALVARCAAAGFGLEVTGCGLVGLTARQLVQHLRSGRLEDARGRAGVGLQKLLEDLTLDDGAFDLVLIMAGTNDVLAGSDPAAIAGDLKRLHAACHERNTCTAVLSIPDLSCEEGRSTWLAVNEELGRWVKHEGAGQGQSASCPALFVDTARLLPFDEQMRERGFWEPDGVHFSETGYAYFGKALALCLLSFFGQDAGVDVEGGDAEDAQEDRCFLILGDAVTAGEGADLMGTGGWAYQLADAVEYMGFQVENRAMAGTSMCRWQSLLALPEPELQKLLATAQIVVFAASLDAELLAQSCDEPAAQEVERQLLEDYRAIVRALRACMSSEARLVLGGPCPSPAYGSRHASALERLRDAARALEGVDHVVDFLQPAAHDGSGGWAEGLSDSAGQPNDLGHRRMFECVDVAAVLGQ